MGEAKYVSTSRRESTTSLGQAVVLPFNQRKESRTILYRGIYLKFNRIFNAVNAFRDPKQYTKVSTTDASGQ
jgi:hypothetical protein